MNKRRNFHSKALLFLAIGLSVGSGRVPTHSGKSLGCLVRLAVEADHMQAKALTFGSKYGGETL